MPAKTAVAVLVLAAVLPAVLASGHQQHQQQQQHLLHQEKRAPAATPTTPAAAAGNGGIQTPPPFTGTLPASVSSLIATISAGTYTQPTQALPTVYQAGAQPPISNAPPLPAASINPSDWPALDTPPDVTSSQVKQWIAKIDWSKVPNIPATTGGAACSANAAAAANASATGSCWWTCGQCTRDTDITVCPDKNTWGVSYDDGPSPYTPTLLNYLEQQKIKSTFFVVGSRVVSRPQMVQTEYMLGHQLSVHTWSHTALTTQSNEQIVAELGWTQYSIKYLTGVSPNTMRPPYGDIDDRVRAIALQMGMTPIIWTSLSSSESFDTEDWKIGAGVVSAAESVSKFSQIITQDSQTLKTGFIVLAHDLYVQSVDLAVSVVLPQALAFKPKLTLQPIITCLKKPLSEAYVETASNKTTPSQVGSGSGSSSGSSSGSGNAAPATVSHPSAFLALAALLVLSAAATLGYAS